MRVGEELAALGSSCREGLRGLAKPVCALAGASFPPAAPASGLCILPTPGQEGRERELAAPGPSMVQAQEK